MYTSSQSHRWLAAAIFLSSTLALAACKPQEPKPVPGPEGAAAAEPVSAEAKTAAKQIAADYLRDQITKISSDEFEGRGPATPGDTKTREYLVEQLKQIGFEPGASDGSYQQIFDVVGVTSDMPKQWSFKKDGKTVAFKW